MSSINRVKKVKKVTHEGAPAAHINAEQQLRRSVCACMLWESTFYEEGVEVAERIAEEIKHVDAKKVAELAKEARSQMKLRHVPLLIAREMTRLTPHKYQVRDVLRSIIQRPDELAEFLAIYWKEGKQPLSAQVKKGLAEAFPKFDAYQLAKYNRPGAVSLRDVLFMSHAKPKDEEQEKVWKSLIEGTLSPPDTWEVALSGGADKKEAWTRLLRENKLGALALLRNLRNMSKAGVDEDLVLNSLSEMRADRILPFRFIAAAKHAPKSWESTIEKVMLNSLMSREKLPGKTALLVDGSGSMQWPLSAKSELTRFEAACALSILAREMCEKCTVTVFSYDGRTVPDRRGFALRDALRSEAQFGGTNTQNGLDAAAAQGRYDRIIIFTDEQSHQSIRNPVIGSKGYVINISTNQNGIGYGEWAHIDGFSEAVLDYIREFEKL